MLLSTTDSHLLCALTASSSAVVITLRHLQAPKQIITDLEESVQHVEAVVQRGICADEPTHLKTALAAAQGWLCSDAERMAPL